MVTCGLDFGTSNSALGVVIQLGPRLIPVDDVSELIPTAIFFTGGSSRGPVFQESVARSVPHATRRSGSDLLSVALGPTHVAA
jgi:hypothetical chaperone protein